MQPSYEVIVVGGGTAGMIAAIQAARAGKRTLLIEKNGILGGTIVVGRVNNPASFHAYGVQVIAGIGWELCCKARHEEGRPAPLPTGEDKSQTGCFHFWVNPALLAALADEMLLEAGGDILFHAMPACIRRTGNMWNVTVCTKTGLRELHGKILVDCTGDANATELAGYELRRNSELQAATLVARTRGYDSATLNYDAIQAAFAAEVAAGRMKSSDAGWHQGRLDVFLRNYGGNCLHVAVDARTSEAKTQAEIEARRVLLRLARFCRQQPGLEGFSIESCATECGIRETVTIRGKKEITIQGYESGRREPDAVCYSFYPIDSHRSDHLVYRALKPGVYPTIPLGAMLPHGSKALIVAGRCIAGDWEANSAYRVQASCMAMGQAAGAAAALAAERDVDFEDIPIRDLHLLLRRHGAIIPGDLDGGAEPPVRGGA